MQELYCAIWRSNKQDDKFDQAEFEASIPRLMKWLRQLTASGNLVACGGGGFEHHSGGLTILRADPVEHAVELSNGTPMNEIGSTEIFIWDNFYADLQNVDHKDALKSKA